MKKVLDIFKKPLWFLCLGLGIVLLFSIFANMANTSMWSVSVTKVEFETDNGTMTGLLYKPNSCVREKPCATIVTTHGYLNTKEMQDAPAVELSKRGYVVLAMDMYEHGGSTYKEAIKSDEGFNFFINSQYDAVKWVYEQDFVLKAADGTGIIAVSGHSMGGFSSRMATVLDSAAKLSGEPQRIVASLPVGADFKFIGGPGTTVGFDNMLKRTTGTIAAKYDDFFFLDDTNPYYGESAALFEKDWTKTVAGAQYYYGDMTITEAKEFKSGEWNNESYGGAGSVIYVPNEIHPWDHFSVETTAYEIDFYDHAFKTQIELRGVTAEDGTVEYKAGKGQSWWLKEGFECVALAGMFIAIVGAIGTFATLPFFNKANTAAEEINEVKETSKAKKCLLNGLACVTTFALAYLFPSLLGATGNLVTWYNDVLLWIAKIGALVGVALLTVRVVLEATGKATEEGNKRLTSSIAGLAVIIATALFSYWAITYNIFANSNFYNEEMTNVIAKWAFACGGLTLLSLAISHVLVNKRDGYTLANYGLKANWKQVLIALLIAVITVGGVYLITFAVEAVFRVDFRIWTYAIKPFAWRHFVSALRYLPFFFLFYLANAISVVANTGTDKSWKGTLKAILLNICGVVFILALQYGKVFATGTSEWPTYALNILLLFAIIPTLALAAWITRKAYFKTGNIWVAVFINALLFTMMQVANTILHVYQTVAL